MLTLNIYTVSRSIKAPWIKDTCNKKYNKIIRNRINQQVKKYLYQEEVELPVPRSIVNDYDICDYRFNAKDWGEKFKRK